MEESEIRTIEETINKLEWQINKYFREKPTLETKIQRDEILKKNMELLKLY